jgi:hypothetical protein
VIPYTSRAPADNKASVQAEIVEPVVETSSINRIDFRATL